jgi:hypothetical protein
MEDALQGVGVAAAVDLEHPQGGPGMNRGVDIAKGPLVGGVELIRLGFPGTEKRVDARWVRIAIGREPQPDLERAC